MGNQLDCNLQKGVRLKRFWLPRNKLFVLIEKLFSRFRWFFFFSLKNLCPTSLIGFVEQINTTAKGLAKN